MRKPALTLLVALAACAPASPGEVASSASGAAPRDPARNAVGAFLDICGSLDRAAVDQQARSYGFTPIPRDPTATHGNTLYAPAERGGPFGVVAWNDIERRCSLIVGGVDRAALEQAFLGQIAAFERAAELRVERLGAAELAEINRSSRSDFVVRQAAVIGVRVAGAGRGTFWALHFRQVPDPLPNLNRLDVQMTRAPAGSLPPNVGDGQAVSRI